MRCERITGIPSSPAAPKHRILIAKGMALSSPKKADSSLGELPLIGDVSARTQFADVTEMAKVAVASSLSCLRLLIIMSESQIVGGVTFPRETAKRPLCRARAEATHWLRCWDLGP